MLANEKAGNYDPEDPAVKQIRKMILDYVEIVDPEELNAVRSELDDIETEWEYRTTGTLIYTSFKQEKKLLEKDTSDDRFRTMNSMRNVDAQAGIYLLGR